MNLLLHYDFLTLDVEKTLIIIEDIKKNKKKHPELSLVGIYLENIKSIHQEIFPYLIEFCKFNEINLIFFDIPAFLRIHFYLENITIKFGCGFLELF